MSNQQAAIAIDDNLFAIVYLEHIATKPDHHRDAQGAGNYCRVGSHASARERNSIRAQPQVGDIRRAEGSGYKNAACRRRREPHCMSCCATAEAAHVVRTLGQ